MTGFFDARGDGNMENEEKNTATRPKAGKKKIVRLDLRINESFSSMLDELAEEEGLSKTAILENCVRRYYMEESVDENLFLARMSTLEKKLDWLNNKTETFYKLVYHILPFILAHLPPLPKDKAAAQAVLDSGSQRMTSLVLGFRKMEKENDISFVQKVWGDTQETLEETYMRSR